MPTTAFYPDANPETSTVDGEVGNSGAARAWATVRGGDGANYAADDFDPISVLIQAAFSPDTGLWSGIQRSILLFDTSVIGSGTPTAATLNLFVTGKQSGFSQSLDVVASTPASNTALVAADYNQLGTTLLGSINVSDLTTNAYNSITLNASGLAAIATGGITKLGLRMSGDRTNTEPTWSSGTNGGVTFRCAEHSPAGSAPYLNISYTSSPVTLNGYGMSGAAERALQQPLVRASGSPVDRVASRTVIVPAAVSATLSRSFATGRDSENPRSNPMPRGYDSAAEASVILPASVQSGLVREVASAADGTLPVSLTKANAGDRAATSDVAATRAVAAVRGSDASEADENAYCSIIATPLPGLGLDRTATWDKAVAVAVGYLTSGGRPSVASRDSQSSASLSVRGNGRSEPVARDRGAILNTAVMRGADAASVRELDPVSVSAKTRGREVSIGSSRELPRAVAATKGSGHSAERISARTLAASGVNARERTATGDQGFNSVTCVGVGESISVERDGGALAVASRAIGREWSAASASGASIGLPMARGLSRETNSGRELASSIIVAAGTERAAANDRGNESTITTTAGRSSEASRESALASVRSFTASSSTSNERTSSRLRATSYIIGLEECLAWESVGIGAVAKTRGREGFAARSRVLSPVIIVGEPISPVYCIVRHYPVVSARLTFGV